MKQDDFSFWKNKRVFVPGGAGCIGSHLCELLVEWGSRVAVLDSLASGSVENLSRVADKIDFEVGDVRDELAMGRLLKGVDVVLNFAGIAPGLCEGEEHHESLYENNVEIADAVLNSTLQSGVGRLLVVSSSCVYPDDAIVPTPELSIEQGEPERANLGYGLAKREIERRAQAAAEESNLKVAIVRPFNAYSDRDLFGGKGGHVIPSLVERILLDDGNPLVVWGSGQQTRSFIHGADVARGIAMIAQHCACGEAVNVGSRNEVRISELVNILMRLSGVKRPVIFDTSKPEGASRKGADTSLLIRLVGGFSEQIDFQEGLATIVAKKQAMLATNGA